MRLHTSLHLPMHSTAYRQQCSTVNVASCLQPYKVSSWCCCCCANHGVVLAASAEAGVCLLLQALRPCPLLSCSRQLQDQFLEVY
jgi:hypothetical protein